jgi:hypothetical protein
MRIARLAPALQSDQVEQFFVLWKEDAPADHGLHFEFDANGGRVTVTSRREGIPTNWDPADLHRTFAIVLHRVAPGTQIDWEQ